VIRIDGSRGEGGGQVLRTALALAARLKLDVEIENVRAQRPKPGLRPQHLAVVRALAAICDAEVEGAEVGSRLLTFRPGETRKGEFEVDAGTAGSVTLMLQGVLPAALKRGARLLFRGGTDVPMAPTLDYLTSVFLPLAVGFGAMPRWSLSRRGLAPSGGGEVEVEVAPTRLKSFTLPPPEPRGRLELRVVSSRLPAHVAERIAAAFEAELRGKRPRLLEAMGYSRRAPEDPRSKDVGVAATALVFSSRVLGAAAVGERGRLSEDIGRSLARSLLADLEAGADVDANAADQILVYGALAPPLEFAVREATSHLMTNAEVVEAMTGTKVRVSPLGPGRAGHRVRVG
jgi:RNA 3'-phosphate cyclase